MILNDYTNDELIAELKDRGFVIQTKEVADEVEDCVDSGIALCNLIDAMKTAIVQGNIRLQQKIVSAMIFAATGDEFQFEEQVAA
jgi:hypothetical protein